MSLKLKNMVVATAGALLFSFGINAMADTTDDIVQAMITKGLLTEEEGALLMRGRGGEKEAAEKKKTSEIKASFQDGIKFESGDKTVNFAVGGRIHADYRSFEHGHNASMINGNTANEADTFDMRRARIELKGKFYDTYEFLLSGDFSGQTAGNTGSMLDQAWMNVNYWKPLQFRAGQFKVPMSMERKMSSNAIDFMERSLHDSLGSYEDRGVMVWGIPKDGLTYAFAVVNGEGNKNRNEADSRVSKPEFQVNSTVNFAQLMDNKDAVFHLGAGFSDTDISKNNNASGTGTAAGNNTFWIAGNNAIRSEARGVNFLTLPGLISANGVSNAINRKRYAGEAAVALGPVKVTGEYLKNSFSGDLTTSKSFNADINAFYVSALWNITGEKFADFYKDGIFTAVKPSNNFEPGKGKGAWQVGVRYSHIDASDFNNDTFASDTANNVAKNVLKINRQNNTFKADGITLGLNFIPTPNTRFMLNYIETRFDKPILIEGTNVGTERAITTRAQWNF